MAIFIKPHHFFDIIKLYGSGLSEFVPDETHRHAFYSVGNEILRSPNAELRFTVCCDDICAPCISRGADGLCTDPVENLPGYTSKDTYNKMLDRRLIERLGLELNRTYTSREYCELLYANRHMIPEIWDVEPPNAAKRRFELFCLGCERYLAAFPKTAVLSCCGCVCSECPYYPGHCLGCPAIKGNVFWLEFTGGDICEIYDCCVNSKKLEHCGKCPELPCNRYDQSDPTKSTEENAADFKKQMEQLRSMP